MIGTPQYTDIGCIVNMISLIEGSCSNKKAMEPRIPLSYGEAINTKILHPHRY